jgi:hypothetical protein
MTTAAVAAVLFSHWSQLDRSFGFLACILVYLIVAILWMRRRHRRRAQPGIDTRDAD